MRKIILLLALVAFAVIFVSGAALAATVIGADADNTLYGSSARDL